MDSQLVQLVGSLVAILVLAGIAWWLKLGQPDTITDTDRAFALAREADTGFEPTDAAVAQDGNAAILADSAGRIMVLRSHGAQFAARVLEPGARVTNEAGVLAIATTDRRFGTVRLDLGDAAQAWAARVDALHGDRHA